MSYVKKLSEIVNKLSNAKARINFLDKLLKYEKEEKKINVIVGILANAKKELREEEEKKLKNEESKEKELEDMVQKNQTIANVVDEIPEEVYKEKLDENLEDELTGKALKSYSEKPTEAYVQEEGSAYRPDQELESYQELLTSEGSRPEIREKTEMGVLEGSYKRQKEVEGYKKGDALEAIKEAAKKEFEEQEEYRKKKLEV